jgi:RNA polymerase sigma-70 factor (ECF subfamily)
MVNRLIIKDKSLNDFETVYKENYQKMYRIALKMINDKDAVYDILQDIFLSYYQKSRKGYEIKTPKSWLVRATINKCIDYSKLRKRHTKIDGLETNLINEDEIEKGQDKEFVKIALSKLKPREKALALLYGEGMSYKDISEISNIKLSSVGKMLSRTLKKLDGILKQMNYERMS